jgi:hypothetical protein
MIRYQVQINHGEGTPTNPSYYEVPTSVQDVEAHLNRLVSRDYNPKAQIVSFKKL